MALPRAIPRQVTVFSRLNEDGWRRLNVFDELEKQAAKQALDACDGNITHAADRLGIYRQTLQRKMKAWGLR
jgi:transcriptional regulator of acetoin/glycerol metabolism